MINKNNQVVVEFYINDNKELFDDLNEKKDVIESELGYELVWDRLDGNKASRMKYYINGLDFDNHDNYPQLMDEIIKAVVKMRKVFKKYI